MELALLEFWILESLSVEFYGMIGSFLRMHLQQDQVYEMRPGMRWLGHVVVQED